MQEERPTSELKVRIGEREEYTKPRRIRSLEPSNKADIISNASEGFEGLKETETRLKRKERQRDGDVSYIRV